MKLSRLFTWLSAVTSIAMSAAVSAQTVPGNHKLSLPYVDWTYPASFTKLEADLKFVADPGSNVPYFYAHQFSLTNSSGADTGVGYIGLQTRTTGVGGKGVVFSVWDATAATPGPGVTCQPFGGEGVGMQCFKAYAWSANKTYRLRVVSDRGVGFSGTIVDMSTTPPTETYLGQIKNPPNIVGFARYTIQWAEYYGQNAANCADYANIKALWSRPAADGGAVVPGAPYKHFGDPYCKNSEITASGTGHFQELGNPGISSQRHLMNSGGKIIRAATTTLGCGGNTLVGDSTSLGNCTQLTRVALPGGKVALQAENGLYLSCTGGGGSTVVANMRSVGNNETFTETVSLGKVSYKSFGGKYLTSPSYGALDLRCSATYAGTTEKFTPMVNLARSASATASSESAATFQTANKAIDGGIDGFPGDYTREWATNGQSTGWIQLNWPTAKTIKQIFLYDRPNSNDRILAGRLEFSNGASVPVGELPNTGAGLKVSFTSRSVTWVRFVITNGVGNVGLAEIEAY